MTSQEFLSIAGSIIATLGGGGIIVFALSGWLGKVWAERLMKASIFSHEKELETLRDKYTVDLEKLKMQLKKSEFIFEKEFIAASKLVEYYEEIIPLSQHPDMHMDDVFESIALQAENVEAWVKQFVSSHGAVLPDLVAKNLMMAARYAGEIKFSSGTSPHELPIESVEGAEEIYNRIRSARDAMRERIWQQSST